MKGMWRRFRDKTMEIILPIPGTTEVVYLRVEDRNDAKSLGWLYKTQAGVGCTFGDFRAGQALHKKMVSLIGDPKLESKLQAWVDTKE